MELHDPTHGTSEPTRFWSTANIGEATPDALSPMCWSFWGPNMEAGARRAYCDFGILPASELAVPSDPNDLLTSYFFGRPAMNLDRLRTLFDAIPGMTADDFERDICGEVREGLPAEPNGGRTLHVLVRAPSAMALAGRRVRRYADDQRVWWMREAVDGGAAAEPRRVLVEAAARFREAFRAHVRARFVLMSLQAQLTQLAETAGRPDLVVHLLAGMGGIAETDVADDLWQVGNDLLPIAEFVRRHGFHGPNEGNLTSTTWREDDAAILQLAAVMAERPAERRPRTREAAVMASRTEAMAELMTALPRSKRRVAGLLCAGAARSVQTLEIGKASFLMALDGGRAAARMIDHELRTAGVLEEVDDAFYLTIDELLAPLPADVMDLVRFRRKRRDEYRGQELPLTFTGVPVPTSRLDERDGRVDSTDTTVTGIAGAPGAAVGRARVVIDPDAGASVDEGEILVCRFTDPSWAPLFSLADALVIDIGAAASHGAIVARELGVPCVIGTGDGTRRIRTGDLLRVDGSTGQVEILERAPESAGAA